MAGLQTGLLNQGQAGFARAAEAAANRVRYDGVCICAVASLPGVNTALALLMLRKPAFNIHCSHKVAAQGCCVLERSAQYLRWLSATFCRKYGVSSGLVCCLCSCTRLRADPLVLAFSSFARLILCPFLPLSVHLRHVRVAAEGQLGAKKPRNEWTMNEQALSLVPQLAERQKPEMECSRTGTAEAVSP